MSSIIDELDAAVLSLERARQVNYVNLASLTLLSYDLLLTFPDEVRLVWPSKWTAGKVLFFFTRYPAFLDIAITLTFLMYPNLNTNLCAPLYKAGSWMSLAGIVIAEVILMMRTYALYGRSRIVAVFLTSIMVSFNIPNIILLHTTLNSLTYLIPSPFPTIAPCIPLGGDRIVFVDFILLMVSELVVVVMTVWKGFSHWRANKSPLMKTMFEDGLLYFIYLFIISLANAVMLTAAPIDYSNLLLELQRVLHAMLTARVLLHIRNAMSDDVTNPGMDSMSFAAAPGKRQRGADSNFSDDSVELGQLQSNDASDSGFSARMQPVRIERRGRLGVHITTGTLADEDLHKVGLESRTARWFSKEKS